MNRKNFLSLIILDIIVIVFAFGLIVFRYKSLTDFKLQPLPKPLKEIKKEYLQPMRRESALPAASTEIVKTPDTPPKPSVKRTQPPRNIGFTYKNSKAKNVAIIGSFNNWVPEQMRHDKDFTWKISVALEPGEHSYNFVVDGRPIRDPYNPRASNSGRGFVSSYLKVKPLAEERNQSE